MIISWTDALWLIANGLLAVSSLMCLGKLVSRGTTLLATRLSYVVTPLGAMIAIAGFLQDRIHAIYLGELLEILGMLIISVRIYHFLSQEDNGKYGAYVGEERRRPPEDNHRMAMKPRRTMRS